MQVGAGLWHFVYRMQGEVQGCQVQGPYATQEAPGKEGGISNQSLNGLPECQDSAWTLCTAASQPDGARLVVNECWPPKNAGPCLRKMW